jgi:periplasmic protein TonB
MTEAATDIIVSRNRGADPLTATLAWSVLAHIVAVALVSVSSLRPATTPPRQVMTVSLGGSPGPRTGGLTQMGGRQVQEVAPPRVERRPDPPPAARQAPALPQPRPRPETKRAQEKPAPPEAKPAPPSTGEVVTEGNTRTDTRVRGQGFGLSSAGGAAGGPVQLDVSDFCCPEYLEQMVTRIQGNWQQNLGVAGTTVVMFVIARDGSLQAIRVERSSGAIVLDAAAERAVRLTARLGALPAQFPNSSLTVHLRFDAQR